MVKSKKLQRKFDSRCHAFNIQKLSSWCMKLSGDARNKKHVIASNEKEWDDVVCSVCMDFPHNAVLLLCSSYNKGCRPYMCSTSNRYSNCLAQYKKACSKITAKSAESSGWSIDDIESPDESGLKEGKQESSELLCPLCRGQVKGWTVVESARRYLNMKKRSCMLDKCSFVGAYKELRKHVKMEHPLSQPGHIDPSHAEKWKNLENERELGDVFSTIRATMPGAIIMGDYVIERNHHHISTNYDRDDSLDVSRSRFSAYGMLRNDHQPSANNSFLDVDFGNHQVRDAVTSGVFRRYGGLPVERQWRRSRRGR